MLLDVQSTAVDHNAGLATAIYAASNGTVAIKSNVAKTLVESDFDMGWKASISRMIDFITALLALGLIAPVLLLLVIAVRLSSPGAAIFAHQRIGRFGVPFPCLKLRTMVVDSEAVLAAHLRSSPEARREWDQHFKLKNDPRVTRIGRVLRKTSLDELPQLFNIIMGQMSLVGPRPIVEAEVRLYGAYFADYCSVRPGLTGLWQISGRNDISYEERVQLDSHYARNKSLLFDFSILTRTIPAVLGGSGSY